MGDEIDPDSVPAPPEKRKRGRPRKVRPPNPFEAPGPPVTEPAPPDALTCDGCGLEKAREKFSRFLELSAQTAEWEVDRLCDHCATYGTPLENPLAQLSPKEIEAFSVLAAGGSMARAARVLGCDEKQIRQYLAGREKPVIRAAYQKLCLQMGITPERLARVLVEALGASKQHFSADGELLGESPDHNIRLKAAGMALKILQLEQPTELSKRAADEDTLGRMPIFTNLGDGQTITDDGYVIPYTAPRQLKDVN